MIIDWPIIYQQLCYHLSRKNKLFRSVHSSTEKLYILAIFISGRRGPHITHIHGPENHLIRHTYIGNTSFSSPRERSKQASGDKFSPNPWFIRISSALTLVELDLSY